MVTLPGEESLFVTISADGSEIRLEAKGYEGNTCSIALNGFGKALGKIESMTKKSEFYSEETATEVTIVTK